MEILSIVFIVLAGINITFAIIKLINNEEKSSSISAICGWVCAILYCIQFATK